MDKYLTFHDVKCYYADEGQGDVLLFVHGFCEDGTMWDAFKQPFLSRYRIITVDLPGYYRSELPNKELSIDIMAAYLLAVLDKEGIEKCTIIGHSMGGYAAMLFAKHNPSRLNKLVLFHSHVFADGDEKRANRQKTVTFMQKYGTSVFLKELYSTLFASTFAENNNELIDELWEHGKEYKAATIIQSQQAMMQRIDTTDVLRTLQVPVLFIVGKQDNSIPYEQSLQQSHIPATGMLEVLNEVGHMGIYEAKERTQEMLFKFLKLEV